MSAYVVSWLLMALLWASACQWFMLLGLYPFLQVSMLHSWCIKVYCTCDTGAQRCVVWLCTGAAR